MRHHCINGPSAEQKLAGCLLNELDLFSSWWCSLVSRCVPCLRATLWEASYVTVHPSCGLYVVGFRNSAGVCWMHPGIDSRTDRRPFGTILFQDDTNALLCVVAFVSMVFPNRSHQVIKVLHEIKNCLGAWCVPQ